MLLLPSQSTAVLVSTSGRLQNGRERSKFVSDMAKFRKHVDREEPPPLLSQVYLGCTFGVFEWCMIILPDMVELTRKKM